MLEIVEISQATIEACDDKWLTFCQVGHGDSNTLVKGFSILCPFECKAIPFLVCLPVMPLGVWFRVLDILLQSAVENDLLGETEKKKKTTRSSQSGNSCLLLLPSRAPRGTAFPPTPSVAKHRPLVLELPLNGTLKKEKKKYKNT